MGSPSARTRRGRVGPAGGPLDGQGVAEDLREHIGGGVVFLLFPGGEVEHGVGKLNLVADAAKRLELGGGLVHGEGLYGVLLRPLELHKRKTNQEAEFLSHISKNRATASLNQPKRTNL